MTSFNQHSLAKPESQECEVLLKYKFIVRIEEFHFSESRGVVWKLRHKRTRTRNLDGQLMRNEAASIGGFFHFRQSVRNVAYWHLADIAAHQPDVRHWGVRRTLVR